MITIVYEAGTLRLNGDEGAFLHNLAHCQWDARTHCYRTPGIQYARLIQQLHDQRIPYDDQARDYAELQVPRISQKPFPYQEEAILAWVQAKMQGVIVLPTGTGKSFVGIMAIATAKRSTIIVVPTIDLMHQWSDVLEQHFAGVPVGLIGGGEYVIASLTVITYDSAYRHLERLGNKFGMIIFDECHHLPSASYQIGAEFAIAPYRLGLTATPERVDAGEEKLKYLIGQFVYRKKIREMSGQYLADYELCERKVKLGPQERAEYWEERNIYLNFLRDHAISFGPRSWHQFIAASCRSSEGRRALMAYFRQKEIAQAAPAKLRELKKILEKHAGERILIFTHDNATAYAISKEFLVPVITHQTKTQERRAYLTGFNQGTYSILATSRVLNEGVNVPAANIGVVLSGSGSVREHVQRLGRILRKYGNKRAILYEIITQDTAEEYVSQRRRAHEAYRNKSKEE